MRKRGPRSQDLAGQRTSPALKREFAAKRREACIWVFTAHFAGGGADAWLALFAAHWAALSCFFERSASSAAPG